MTDVNGELGRVGAGDEVRRAEQVEKLFVRKPLSADDHFLVHHRDVRGWASERSGAELEEESC
jgi:hypothetical protein